MTQAAPPSPPPAARRKRTPVPGWLRSVLVIGVVATWLPLVLIALGRNSTSSEPRIQIFQDMGNQPKYREQAAADIFADGRAARPPVEHTVARGQLQDDDHYYRGFKPPAAPAAAPTAPATAPAVTTQPAASFFDALPPQIQLTPAFMKRGQERFNIFCSSCHGHDGSGNGRVAVRANELMGMGGAQNWIQPTDLTNDLVRGRPAGHIFNTITHGIRSMPPHGPQIPVADRWAIVAYIRALQFSQRAPASVVSPEKLQTLR